MSTLRAAFDEERAFLRGCDDEHAVLDRIAGYRVNMATARRYENAQAHAFAEHLVELAEDRLAALKAAAIQAKQRAAEPKVQPVRAESKPVRTEPPPPEPPARPQAASARVDDSEVVRQLQAALAASQEAERRAAEQRDAAERDARRAARERDSMIAAQAKPASEGSMGGTVPSAAARAITTAPTGPTAARLSPPTTLPSAPPNPKPTSAARPTAAATWPSPPSQRPTSPPPARRAVSRTEPPAKPSPTRSAGASAGGIAHPVTTPIPPAVARELVVEAGPALTGADLAAFRRSAGLTQVAAAQRLGVTQGTISKAEGNPRSVLGPGLQEALRLATG